MSSKPPPSDLPIYPFASANDLEAFLEREHLTAPGFYLKLAKKASGIPSVSGDEAVEVALCFGWIDGRANGLDSQWWLIRFTPRRAKSIWSKKNVETIGRLLEEGRVRPAGLAAVEAAKSNGSWERAYAGPATITVPDDFAVALAADPAATSFFDGLNKTNRYAVLWRVETASPQIRAKRIQDLVERLADGKCPGAPAKPSAKSKKNVTAKKLSNKGKAEARKVIVKADVDLAQDAQPRKSRRPGLRRRPDS
ncbi:MAG: hypothetical protein M1825_005706 [Sarcosagium campestre]|nr:MAG: hypothetical protein M1825_005706 [Sarcosagium campestre]